MKISSEFEWVAGDLSLDFHNTVSWDPHDPTRSEGLSNYGDLLGWAEGSGLISPELGTELRVHAERRPEEAVRALECAGTLRANLHALFVAVVEGGQPAERDVEDLNDFLGNAPLKMRFAVEKKSFEWDWSSVGEDLDQFLWPVVWAAVSLLRSDDLGHVRTCASDCCGWLFLDQSRRRNRRWCAMKDCGNKAKAKRYYYRHRRIENHER